MKKNLLVLILFFTAFNFGFSQNFYQEGEPNIYEVKNQIDNNSNYDNPPPPPDLGGGSVTPGTPAVAIDMYLYILAFVGALIVLRYKIKSS